jgi:hypothetical protein
MTKYRSVYIHQHASGDLLASGGIFDVISTGPGREDAQFSEEPELPHKYRHLRSTFEALLMLVCQGA